MAQLGIADDEFIRGKVPMTKQEIRILTLAKAHIEPDSIVYDIGAGTGSLTIEAARLAPQGKVFAIERKDEAMALLRQNIEHFGVHNVTLLQEEAPKGLENLPAADVVLIGGSGGQLIAILEALTPKVKKGGRIVVNAIALQTVMRVVSYMRQFPERYAYDAMQVQINHFEQVGGYDMAKAGNPICIVTCTKKTEN